MLGFNKPGPGMCLAGLPAEGCRDTPDHAAAARDDLLWRDDCEGSGKLASSGHRTDRGTWRRGRNPHGSRRTILARRCCEAVRAINQPRRAYFPAVRALTDVSRGRWSSWESAKGRGHQGQSTASAFRITYLMEPEFAPVGCRARALRAQPPLEQVKQRAIKAAHRPRWAVEPRPE